MEQPASDYLDLTHEQEAQALLVAQNCKMTLPIDPTEYRWMLRTLLTYSETRCAGDRDDD